MFDVIIRTLGVVKADDVLSLSSIYLRFLYNRPRLYPTIRSSIVAGVGPGLKSAAFALLDYQSCCVRCKLRSLITLILQLTEFAFSCTFVVTAPRGAPFLRMSWSLVSRRRCSTGLTRILGPTKKISWPVHTGKSLGEYYLCRLPGWRITLVWARSQKTNFGR